MKYHYSFNPVTFPFAPVYLPFIISSIIPYLFICTIQYEGAALAYSGELKFVGCAEGMKITADEDYDPIKYKVMFCPLYLYKFNNFALYPKGLDRLDCILKIQLSLGRYLKYVLIFTIYRHPYVSIFISLFLPLLIILFSYSLICFR